MINNVKHAYVLSNDDTPEKLVFSLSVAKKEEPEYIDEFDVKTGLLVASYEKHFNEQLGLVTYHKNERT